MAGQWYLLGKEIDHVLKIYFKANSSIDRILYRLILGNTTTMIIFSIMSFFPEKWIGLLFWGYFISVGIFYSWPTRGKIIEESFSTQFSEFSFLDSFEKTIFFVICLMFVVSMPNFPLLENLETFKLIVDPFEKMHSHFWSFFNVLFHPFNSVPPLMNLGWNMYFYFVNLSFYLMAFYGVLKFFLSRRISLLALFALVSSWSLSVFLKKDPYVVVPSTFPLLWIWSILWSVKSSTYRSGLMYGLLCYLGVLLNYSNLIFFPLGLFLLYFYFLKDVTSWYRSQFLKYSMLGAFFILITMITHLNLRFFDFSYAWSDFAQHILWIIGRKSFLSLSAIGTILLLLLPFKRLRKSLGFFVIDMGRLSDLLILVSCLLFLGIYWEKEFLKHFGIIWFIVFLSVLPLEWIFQSISRLRSKRNMIFVIYVLICLLDSHFEGRIRILYDFYKNPLGLTDLIDIKR